MPNVSFPDYPLFASRNKQVDEWFLHHWPFLNEAISEEFKSSDLALFTCYVAPDALDERLEVACKLIKIGFVVDEFVKTQQTYQQMQMIQPKQWQSQHALGAGTIPPPPGGQLQFQSAYLPVQAQAYYASVAAAASLSTSSASLNQTQYQHQAQAQSTTQAAPTTPTTQAAGTTQPTTQPTATPYTYQHYYPY
ncbi:hypothetical protein M422DRAFT_264267 [Sphaerobolus stellatus SS14]|uniref:Uncharacterized protein n=1 Tax=Sphaerobolus stellatus (strain SS14) TaxID=990650 RepID=A0A0C9UWK1_SPHS4|nr:hypothetical protein M422DRAFT_264267 [Sphaerobolus stellatus SS14]